MDELITTAQALAQGMTHREIRTLVTTGVWIQLLRGVYALATSALPIPALRRRAALLMAGEDGWLCGTSALAEWGMQVADPLEVHVAMIRTGIVIGRGVVMHRAKSPDACVERDGIRLERFDAAVITAFVGLKDDRERQELVCRAVRERRTTCARLGAAAGARGRFPGCRRFREIVALVDLGCRSPIEIDYYVLVERPFGLPRAERQRALPRRRGGRVGAAYGDVYYPELRLVVELDGSGFHADEHRRADLRRDLDLAALGIVTIRLTGRQVREEAALTARLLLDAFAERRVQLGLPPAA